jgi:thiol:disulfide interchange protein
MLGSGPEVTAEPFLDADGAHAGQAFRVGVTVTVESGWHVNAHKPLEDYLIPTDLTVDVPEGFSTVQAVYPEPKDFTPSFSTEPMAVYGGTFGIGIAVHVAETVVPGDYVLRATFSYQACDDKACFPPSKKTLDIPVSVRPADQVLTPQNANRFQGIAFESASQPAETVPANDISSAPSAGNDWQSLAEHFDIAASTSGYMSSEKFIEFLANRGADAGMFAGRSVWAVAILILFGGLLLNLTPCVLPLIPINLGIIGAGARAGSKVRGFALGGLYGLAIALVYGALGLVVILGVSTTFGSLNATPWFNGVIAAVFVVLGLAMFDLILIDFTRFQAKLGLKTATGGSYVLAFAMGAISALLAGACVAPVVIATILYAQNQYANGVSVALLLPFLLGAGMGLPWPFAGAGLAFLPKPGMWMVRVKHAFGVFILLFAAYYGYEAVKIAMERHTAPASTASATEGLWTPSLAQGLERAQQEGKPVVIDFWATWCKNCVTMDNTTFKDPAVHAALDAFVPVKFQAEDPADPATAAAMKHFNVLGLPTYDILEPKP